MFLCVSWRSLSLSSVFMQRDRAHKVDTQLGCLNLFAQSAYIIIIKLWTAITFNYGNTAFQTASFFKQWLKWRGLWKLLFCKSWAPTTIFQLFISHALALVSLFPAPVPALIMIMQNSFQNLGYFNMVNQSIFMGEGMQNTKLVCNKVVELLSLKK